MIITDEKMIYKWKEKSWFYLLCYKNICLQHGTYPPNFIKRWFRNLYNLVQNFYKQYPPLYYLIHILLASLSFHIYLPFTLFPNPTWPHMAITTGPNREKITFAENKIGGTSHPTIYIYNDKHILSKANANIL